MPGCQNCKPSVVLHQNDSFNGVAKKNLFFFLASIVCCVTIWNELQLGGYMRCHSEFFYSLNTPLNKVRDVQNLLVLNALGRVDTLPYNLFAKISHFKDWACLAFMHAKEDVIPDDHYFLMRLRAEGCSVVRTPDVHWGVFMQYLSPVLVSHYKYIAILLDDVLLPKTGSLAINVPRLLSYIEDFNLSLISPSVGGGAHFHFRPGGNYTENRCLTNVEYIETFLQIFTNDAWNKYHSMLHYSGGRGHCYDTCFKVLNPSVRIAVDYSQAAWHMESEIPKHITESLNDTSLPKMGKILPRNGSMYSISKKVKDHLCKMHHCNRPEMLKKSILKCSSRRRPRYS